MGMRIARKLPIVFTAGKDRNLSIALARKKEIPAQGGDDNRKKIFFIELETSRARREPP
jgi:hypothetical protein